jgi:hypothetical protein
MIGGKWSGILDGRTVLRTAKRFLSSSPNVINMVSLFQHEKKGSKVEIQGSAVCLESYSQALPKLSVANGVMG